MKIKTNDTVKIIAGKDKGKEGKVLQVLPKMNRVSVEGVNLLTKYLKPSNKNQKGQKIQFPSPIDASSVKVICPNCSKPIRIGYKVDKEKNSKDRVCSKCKSTIQ